MPPTAGSGAAVAGYNIYWGLDAGGSAGSYQTTANFTPALLTANGSYHLRVQAQDTAGNLSGWNTLFSYHYSKVEVTKYYDLGGVQGMRANNANYTLIGDQVSSTVMVVDANGNVVAQSLYYPFGQERYRSGTMPTDKTYTSQREEDFGLLDYNARYYSAALGSFVSPDTLVPQPSNMLDWNRYGYVHGNPVRLNDPSGRYYEEEGPGKKNINPIPVPAIIKFVGNDWTVQAKNNINQAALAYGNRALPYIIRKIQLYRHMGLLDGEAFSIMNGVDAFAWIFGEVTFMSHTNTCAEYFSEFGVPGAVDFECYGCAAGSQLVLRFSNAPMDQLTPEWAGHELGHVFDLHIDLAGRNSITGWMLASLDGIANNRQGMVQNASLVNYEIFANMMDSWVFNVWAQSSNASQNTPEFTLQELGVKRKSFFDNFMALWVANAILGN